jgi:HAD superfamily hydrolase (TIGR01509 family)
MISTQIPVAVIFDFDGVVVDSLAVHITAWQVSYRKLYGMELIDTVGLPGRSTMAIAEILASRVGRPETKDELAELKRDALRESRHTIKLLPGAGDAFNWLRGRGIPFGIASNAPRAFIESTLDNLNIDVEIKFGIDDVKRGKPEPDVFLKCAKALGVSVLDHTRVIVFEDSPHGLAAAVKAGMFPIGVLTQNSADEMRKSGAKAVCQDIGEAFTRGWLSQLPS